MLYGGDPGWVEKRCVSDSGEAAYINASRCEVLEADAESCPEPAVAAVDHHGKSTSYQSW